MIFTPKPWSDKIPNLLDIFVYVIDIFVYVIDMHYFPYMKKTLYLICHLDFFWGEGALKEHPVGSSRGGIKNHTVHRRIVLQS